MLDDLNNQKNDHCQVIIYVQLIYSFIFYFFVILQWQSQKMSGQTLWKYKTLIFYQIIILKMRIIALLLLVVISFGQSDIVYYTSCNESTATDRTCSSQNNKTDFLLSLKKGGINILSKDNYLVDYLLCEEYNYDCGYIEDNTQFISVANGVELNLTSTQLDTILVNDSALATKIKPYIGKCCENAKCGMSMFPLTLTSTETNSFLGSYMETLATKVSTQYLATKKNTSKIWTDININIKTAVLETMKENIAEPIVGNQFWDDFLDNNFTDMSKYLKNSYNVTKDQQILHSSYLIDSVTSRCNKYQSVNFLVDESGSITSARFETSFRTFLRMYVNETLDDHKIMSCHFYDSSFDPWIYYGNNKTQFAAYVENKTYRGLGTLTGKAINQTVPLIEAANFPNGVPKLLVVLTDGNSFDPVLEAANNARSKGIILIAVGVGTGTNMSQLIQLGGSVSNVINLQQFSDLPKLVEFISNYFCKQIITINLGDNIVGNIVRVPESPNFYRVPKSNVGQFYELDIYYDTNPNTTSQNVQQSQIDPFPDQFTQYIMSESYTVNSTFKVYFIQPQNLQNITVKKNLTQYNVNVDTSYLSFAGYNMGFNISLRICTTINCTYEKELYRPKNQTNNNTNNNTNNTTTTSDTVTDYTVYAYIGGGLGMVGCFSLVIILAIKRLSQKEDQNNNIPPLSEDQHMLSNKSKASGRARSQHNRSNRSRSKSKEKDKKKSRSRSKSRQKSNKSKKKKSKK